jgi:hypothetical protein
MGTQLREAESGFRYTPTTCFETFPMPAPDDIQRNSIADAARQLDSLRLRWLNPPDLLREEVLDFPASTDGPWGAMVDHPDQRGIGTAQYRRLVPIDDESALALKKRTLTNLYNEWPTWLENAHGALDNAVFAAYGWDSATTADRVLELLLERNLAFHETRSPAHGPSASSPELPIVSPVMAKATIQRRAKAREPKAS